MSVSTIGVLGLGLFGSSVARTLAANNVDVIAIDKNMDHVEEVLDEVTVAVQGDFTKLIT
jgi:K+ transport systems, NAD-binding component